MLETAGMLPVQRHIFGTYPGAPAEAPHSHIPKCVCVPVTNSREQSGHLSVVTALASPGQTW